MRRKPRSRPCSSGLNGLYPGGKQPSAPTSSGGGGGGGVAEPDMPAGDASDTRRLIKTAGRMERASGRARAPVHSKRTDAASGREVERLCEIHGTGSAPLNKTPGS